MQKFDWIPDRVAELEHAQRESSEGARLKEDARDLVEVWGLSIDVTRADLCVSH